MEELLTEYNITIPTGKPNANIDPPTGTGMELWQAASIGDYDTLEKLIKEWNGNKVVLNWEYINEEFKEDNFSPYGSTPLKVACLSNCIRCIILLVNLPEVEVNLNYYKNGCENLCCGTAIWLSALIGNLKAVEVLLKVDGIDIKKKHTDKTPLEAAIYSYKILISETPDNKALIENHSKIIALLEEAESQYRPPLQRMPSNTFIPETPPEKLPTITISIHGHGKELPNNELIKKNYKGEDLDVRVYSAASELGVCGIHFIVSVPFEKQMDRILVSAFKTNSEMSSYNIIKKAIEQPAEEYRQAVSAHPYKSGKDSVDLGNAKFSANRLNTWHTYVPIWDKVYTFNDPQFGNWIHVLHRTDMNGNVLNEDPDKLLNLVKFDDARRFHTQQTNIHPAWVFEEPIPRNKQFMTPSPNIMSLNKIVDSLSYYGFKVINIIDHTCRAVDTTINEDKIKEFYQKEQQQKINQALGGEKKRKSKKNKRKNKKNKRKTKTHKKG
jgi:hypothetical protein